MKMVMEMSVTVIIHIHVCICMSLLRELIKSKHNDNLSYVR